MSADKIAPGGGGSRIHAIDLRRCSPATDFGRGFYTTTNPRQARSWANQCALNTGETASVIGFDVNRIELSRLTHLVFVRPTADFYSLVGFSRHGGLLQGRSDGVPYDVVHGPLAVWPQNFVMAGCDQISFHTETALRVLSVVSVVSFPSF